MSFARTRAKDILRELHIDSPDLLKHLKEICCERGVFVREGNIEGAEARLTVSGNKGIITVNPNNAYASRTRFSIAHELGHFELHRHRKHLLSCDQRALNEWSSRQSTALESEANEFASELLLPEKFIKLDILHEKPGFRLLETLAERYQTSLFATTRRYIEITPEACAAVFFKHGIISHVWKSYSFEQQGYRIEGSLDPYSYAFDAASGSETPDYMSTVEAQTWLDVPHQLAEEPVFEEARFFPTLEMGMSLLWIKHGRLLRYLAAS